MNDQLLLFGLLLGVLQLLVGVGIGMWIARPNKAGVGAADQQRAKELSAQLRELTAEMNQSAREQGDKLQQVDDRLRDEPTVADHPLTSLVTGVVREMMQANLRLQEKLTSTELELEAQSLELSEHVQQAMTDSLTGLPNRRALDDHLCVRMQAWRKHKTPFSVMMLDVDHFKQFNDTHGHLAGDEALKAVGAAVQQALRQHDVVARYGGEEFAIVLPHTTLEAALPAVRKAIDAVRGLNIQAGEKQVAVTASGGVASLLATEKPEQLIERADQALYKAKQNGRDRAWQHDGSGLFPLENTEQLRPAPAQSAEPEADVEQVCLDLRSSFSAFLGDEAEQAAVK